MKRLLFFAILAFVSAGLAQAPPTFPRELTSFTPLSAKPIFAGVPGQWDAMIRERGWIVIDKGTWKLYYTGYDSPTGLRRLGLATSPDGLNWTRHPGNPLVKDEWIEDMTIVKDGDRWIMFAEGKDDQAHWFTSDDGLTWSRRGPIDIRKTDGSPISPGPYGTPAVVKGDQSWFLLYERGDRGIWLAESNDFTTWKHVQDDPVMTPGPGEYDRDLIAMNQVIRHEGRYYAIYHGCKNVEDKTKRRWATGLATSTDLKRWEKYPGNPLVPLDENKSSGMVVPVAGGYRLYTMHPQVWAFGPKK
jgi:predicted GH43/DUF377 family glycosyl hydrolase